MAVLRQFCQLNTTARDYNALHTTTCDDMILGLIVSMLCATVVRMTLEAFADLIGCTVTRDIPLSGYWGEYDATRHEIRLHPRLAGIQEHTVLAHELGHAAYRHDRSTVHNECEANLLGDWLRIPLCAFLRATQMYSTAQAVAHELEVLPADVRRYAQRLWRQ